MAVVYARSSHRPAPSVRQDVSKNKGGYRAHSERGAALDLVARLDASVIALSQTMHSRIRILI
jgi:hypothetical protein